MIQYLRVSVRIQSPDAEQDPNYLTLSDEDLLLYLNTAMGRNYPDIPDLKFIPSDAVYGLIILAKRELYYTLASKSAPLYDMGADNNNYLKRSQLFEHYMKLAEDAGKEYDNWLENGGGEDALGTLRSYNVVLSDRYATKYNYENSKQPKVILYDSEVTNDSATVQWTVRNIGRFFSYKVYISTEPILDMFSLDSNHIKEGSKPIADIRDIHQTGCKITNLEADTQYYIAVVVSNLTGLRGYAQIEIQTESAGE